jgi:hexosaminidase
MPMRSPFTLAVLIAASSSAALSSARSQTAPRISSADRAAIRLMPLPASLRRTGGFLALGRGLAAPTGGCRDARVARAVERLGRELDSLAPGASASGAKAPLAIRCGAPSNRAPRNGDDESYALTVRPDGVTLSAASPIGALRGLETLRQLVERDGSGLRIPAVIVQDRPRYPWRGLMIDVSRHWMPKEVILRNLAAMAAVKLNVLHLHLSDDQGFRVESKLYPRLHEAGSGGHYYSQDDVREIVAFAGDRGIRVVPEFDLPGHSTSWLVAYPELGSAPGPYTLAREYGIHDATLDPTREETYRFLDRFFGEMATLFPDEYVHIGGDEVSAKTHWISNARIQQFVAEHGLKDRHGLQAYFNRRMQQLLARHGRKLAGWDEILSDSLDRSAVIQSWRGQSSLLEAVNAGFDAILSAGWYLDFKLPAADHYRVDPARASVAARIAPDSAHWKTWKLRLSAGQGSLESQLTLFGTPEHPSGALEFAGAASPTSTATVAGDSMHLRFESGQTPVVVDAVVRGDSLRGTMSTYGFTLPLSGVRSGGSDMPGTAMPAFKVVAPLTAASARRILGGEAAMWSENVSAGTVDSRLAARRGDRGEALVARGADAGRRRHVPAAGRRERPAHAARCDARVGVSGRAALAARHGRHRGTPHARRRARGGEVLPAHGVRSQAVARARAAQSRRRRAAGESHGAHFRAAGGRVPRRRRAPRRYRLASRAARPVARQSRGARAAARRGEAGRRPPRALRAAVRRRRRGDRGARRDRAGSAAAGRPARAPPRAARRRREAASGGRRSGDPADPPAGGSSRARVIGWSTARLRSAPSRSPQPPRFSTVVRAPPSFTASSSRTS